MMCELVGVQVRLLIESLVAARVWTAERLLTRVDAHVRLQVEVEREPLAAQVALVGLLAGVHEHVPLELRVVKEPLATALMSALEQLIAMDRIVLLQ